MRNHKASVGAAPGDGDVRVLCNLPYDRDGRSGVLVAWTESSESTSAVQVTIGEFGSPY